MNIVWQYLDKKGATINALRDYRSMEHIIDQTDEDVTNIHDKMRSVRSPVIDGMPKTHNPKAGEEHILNGIDQIDVCKERYRQAAQYMDWFTPAWGALTEDERYVLVEFYMNHQEQQIEAVYNVCERFSIERSSAYNKKNRALQHLTLLLYGK